LKKQIKKVIMKLHRKPGIVLFTLFAAAALSSFSVKENPPPVIKVSSFGKQPTMTADAANNLHVTFGQGNEIFYAFSSNGGISFSTPAKIGEQPKLSLGTTRGPQIISTDDYVVIAAPDHTGKIMAYRLKHGEKEWSAPVNILKGDSTAKEGFVAIAAGKDNHLYAAWLDLRIGKHNNVFGAYSHDAGKTWSESKLIYASPDGRVCPCCRPSISADRKGNVYVMFRNDLKGARDLYLVHSKDGGKTFSAAEKLGTGTWNFDKCPMDGGAVSMDSKGNVGTTWRRESTVYFAEPGKPELAIAEGARASTLVKNSKGNYLAWQQGNDIMILMPNGLKAQRLGTGTYPRLTSMRDESVVCMWESGGEILATRIP
jgi:hypothetical protein